VASSCPQDPGPSQVPVISSERSILNEGICTNLPQHQGADGFHVTATPGYYNPLPSICLPNHQLLPVQSIKLLELQQTNGDFLPPASRSTVDTFSDQQSNGLPPMGPINVTHMDASWSYCGSTPWPAPYATYCAANPL
jgi:hypothetical protein